MAQGKVYIFLTVALVAASLIFAQEGSGGSPRDLPEQNDGPEPPQGRTFFFTRYVRCNYTAQAGRTCASCRQTLLCLSNNIGIAKTCHGLFRYCNQGRCSYIGGSACNGTSSG